MIDKCITKGRSSKSVARIAGKKMAQREPQRFYDSVVGGWVEVLLRGREKTKPPHVRTMSTFRNLSCPLFTGGDSCMSSLVLNERILIYSRGLVSGGGRKSSFELRPIFGMLNRLSSSRGYHGGLAAPSKEYRTSSIYQDSRRYRV